MKARSGRDDHAATRAENKAADHLGQPLACSFFPSPGHGARAKARGCRPTTATARAHQSVHSPRRLADSPVQSQFAIETIVQCNSMREVAMSLWKPFVLALALVPPVVLAAKPLRLMVPFPFGGPAEPVRAAARAPRGRVARPAGRGRTGKVNFASVGGGTVAHVAGDLPQSRQAQHCGKRREQSHRVPSQLSVVIQI
jgi:hypothetical protein